MKQQKILVVDDEPDILELVQYNLEKEGFAVRTASNGVEAIDLASQWSPHLILLDVMMPEMDGMETSGKRQARRCGHRLPDRAQRGLQPDCGL